MAIAGFLVAAVGAVLLFNLARIDDGLAALSRPFPWWMKSPTADYPSSYRVLGAAFLIMGGAFVAAGFNILR